MNKLRFYHFIPRLITSHAFKLTQTTNNNAQQCQMVT